ncbi:MAG: amidohydrolase family protein, partial [Nocardioidaceae bacterium]
MRLAIRGGTVVSESGPMPADVVCADGRIEALTRPGTAPGDVDETFDATGLLVFPGFIDSHVHSRDPGLTHKETFERSTLAALCGGLTTILE